MTRAAVHALTGVCCTRRDVMYNTPTTIIDRRRLVRVGRKKKKYVLSRKIANEQLLRDRLST